MRNGRACACRIRAAQSDSFVGQAGVIWIIAATIYTASDLSIAIGAVTIGVGWISFMVEFRNRMH
jgi:hypothetical protein